MAIELDIGDVAQRCISGRSSEAYDAAIEANSLVGLAVVGFFDHPEYRRIQSIRKLDGGEGAAVEALVSALISNFSEDCTEHARDYLIDSGHALPVGGAPADRLWAAIDSDDALDDRIAATSFTWLSTHDRARGLAVARSAVPELDAPPTELFVAQLDCLGRSGAAQDHKILLDYAHRRAQASDNAAAATALNRLREPLEDDTSPIAAVLGAMVNSGQPMPAEIRKFLGQIDETQIRGVLERLDLDDARIPHFDAQLLPHLFEVHAANIAPLMSRDIWPPSSIVWLTNSAPWGSHDDVLLTEALRSATDGNREDVAERLRTKLAARVQETAPGSGAVGGMPRIGVRTLLAQALDGTIEPQHPALLSTLSHLECTELEDEYLRANWRQSSRAERFGRILAAASPTDIPAEVVSRAFELEDQPLAAWIRPILGAAEEEQARRLTNKAGGRTVVLQAIASTRSGQSALIDNWEQNDDLESFRAFEGSDCDDPRIVDHIPSAVRNYDNSLSTTERLDLLQFLEQEPLQDVLLEVIDDRKNTGNRPPMELLASAVRQLDPAESAAAIDDVSELCRNHLNIEVRAAAYQYLGRSQPNRDVVTLLLERRSAERPELHGSVEAAMDAIALSLADTVASANGDSEADALELLDAIDPGRALPHARRILDDEVEEPGHRVLAAQIIGSHGSADDTERLKDTHSKEPNPEVQLALKHAIRRLEIGDVADAHVRLGELAGIEADSWDELDPATVWADKQDALVTALERVAKHQSNGDRESTVDQLGAELAKLVLYHTIDLTGDELGLKEADRVAVSTNSLDYGNLVARQQIHTVWPFVSSLNELYRLRTEHLSPKGTWEPNSPLTDEEHTLALALFKRGIGPCLQRLAG